MLDFACRSLSFFDHLFQFCSLFFAQFNALFFFMEVSLLEWFFDTLRIPLSLPFFN